MSLDNKLIFGKLKKRHLRFDKFVFTADTDVIYKFNKKANYVDNKRGAFRESVRHASIKVAEINLNFVAYVNGINF